MKIVIGNAWPYANGSLHVGRLSSLMPGDILARYHRLMGDEVIFVSGSDCNGTPISIKAKEEGVAPEIISERYNDEFKDCFEKLGFSYDLFGKTSSPYHHKIVKKFILELYEKGYIYEKSVTQYYCNECGEFLTDRLIEGICPHCHGTARGDQCEECSEILDPEDLIDRKCKACGKEPEVKEVNHLFFSLSKFENDVRKLWIKQDGWRENAIKLTKRYLDEGLRDRAVTRNISWGVEVPLKGYEDKRIYVWIEAVMAYLSSSIKVCEDRGEDWVEYWQDEDSRIYFVHGKDNIPFHTVIFPALLNGLGIKKPNLRIISSEYMNLEGKKFSTTKNWAVWLPYMVKNYDPDAIRYSLTINGPETKNTDFSWREFVNSNNGELLGAFGNFVNRTLVFIHKNFGGKLSNCELNPKWKKEFFDLYVEVGEKIEDGEFRSSLEDIFTYIRKANKFFDDEKPWIKIEKDKKSCEKTLYTCVQIIANLSNLLEPFIPFSCEKIRKFLSIQVPTWSFIEIKEPKVGEVSVLFERIDKIKATEELIKLKEEKV
ncbi:methionine--tRNA ligase [Clostridium sp. 'White wine YQ']|uniref:methionine--tRNA ligase n=1 Tax=Clostridium sp. 'White wine YQ' TaxID=3027474 RepID=UPI002365247C|nr:methionine--tRNA ligase [Clostridium sp. 'White wine YQ']MDD7795105.1 methionine--tRNA ligase [Clostridium sp. 'White wine YQ']